MNNNTRILKNVEESQTADSKQDNSEALVYSSVLDQVWTYITDNIDNTKYATDQATVIRNQEQILKLIQRYIDEKKPRVARSETESYTLEDLHLRLIEDITQHGPITPAYVDPEVSEIQINDYQTIWIEKNHKFQIMTDEVTGERVKFKSVEECFSVIKRLLKNSGANFSRQDTIAKGRTVEGYRVAATHMEAAANEKGKFQGRPTSPSAVIRKFPDTNYSAKDLVDFKSMTAEIGNTLIAIPKADVTVVIGGPTGSGKTTVIQLILNNIPKNFRIFAIEDPSELGIKLYDEKGNIINNVLQYEALADPTDADKKSNSRHTLTNLMMQALRMTPHYFVFGEIRYNEDIDQAMVAANTGHKFVTSTHAPDDEGTIRRLFKGVMAVNQGLPTNVVMEDVCSNIDFVIIQEKKWDDTRKVNHLTEVCGVKYENGIAQPDLCRIYEFVTERKQPGDTKIKGAHYQVHNFSKKMLDRMLSSSMDIMEYDLIAKPLAKAENGEDIPRLGHYDSGILIDQEEMDTKGVVKALLTVCAKYKARGLECPIDLNDYELSQENLEYYKKALMIAEGRNLQMENPKVLNSTDAAQGESNTAQGESNTAQQRIVSCRMFSGEPAVIGAGLQDHQVAIASAVLDVDEVMNAAGAQMQSEDLDALEELIQNNSEHLGSIISKGGSPIGNE